jgi:hypothetical protein
MGGNNWIKKSVFIVILKAQVKILNVILLSHSQTVHINCYDFAAAYKH